jgi:hypothetical protein
MSLEGDAVDMAVLGLCYVSLGRLEDAQRIPDRARAPYPSNSLVHVARGSVCF